MKKCCERSAQVCSVSITAYLIWLLLPAVQTTCRAVTGAACVALFAAGVMMDWAYFKTHWRGLLARAACAAAMPLLMFFFLRRGAVFGGFYVQHAMFWFPLVYAGYARERGNKALLRGLKWVLLGTVVITVCTTIGWLIQGMLRGGRIYAYSRSLGYAGEGREAYLKELMLRNIGGYDFVYAMAAALPLTCIGIQKHSGRNRALLCVLLGLQTVMIVLSQYTYAMLYAAAVLAVEGTALIIRKASKGRVGLGASLLWGAVPLVLAVLLMQPLVQLAAGICRSIGMNNFAFSFEQLLIALRGGTTSADSRLGYYLTALSGIARSPLTGSMFGGEKLLSGHSDVLDLLSGMGILGAVAVGFMIWLMGRGALKGLKRCPWKAHLFLTAAVMLATASLGTVVYSRDIMAVAAIGTMLVMEDGERQEGL